MILLRHVLHRSIGSRRRELGKEGKLIVCADDLIPLFGACLLHAPRMRAVHAELAFVETFLDARLTFGEASYCLTTIMIALHALQMLPTDT